MHLSGVTVRNRINKLLKKGVIEEFVPGLEAEPFGMDSIYLVASEKNFKEILKRVKIFGKPSHIIHCIGSTAILGIIIKEDYEDKLEYAQQLVLDGKVTTVSTSKSPGFNKIITKTELKIIQALLPNTQISHDEISSLTGFSKKTVSRVMQRLRQNNILHSTIIWNPRMIENYLTFYVGMSVKGNSEKIIDTLTKNFSESFLAAPMVFDKEMALTMYVDNIHQMDEIVEVIKSIENVMRADVYIPKKIELIYDWFNDFVKEQEDAPLHISLSK